MTAMLERGKDNRAMNTVMSRREVLKAGALAAGTLAVPGALAGSAGLSRAEAAPPVTLTATTTADPGLLGVWRGMAKAFHREHPAINVTVLTFPDPDYDQKIDLMLAAGTPPALWWAAGNKGYRYYAARG